MASSAEPKFTRERPSSQLVVKEGFLNKKGGLLKTWSRRYFMLNRQSLVYFRREQADYLKLSPLGRIFLSDIVKIEKEGMESRKSFVFILHTKKRGVCLQAFGDAEREDWINAIGGAMESEGQAEQQDPFRKTLRKLAPGLKRVTLMKDPDKGIGCTIKSAAGHVFVNRIIEDGPIARTGVLRPDDELLDVNGVTITGMSVAEVGQVIRTCPEEFLATVRPITAHKTTHPPDVTRVNYVTVLPILGSVKETRSGSQGKERAVMKIGEELNSSCDSLADVGNYDDEDDYDSSSPPPIPPHTPDMLIDSTQSSSGPERPRSHVSEDARTNYIDVEITHKPTN